MRKTGGVHRSPKDSRIVQVDGSIVQVGQPETKDSANTQTQMTASMPRL